MRPHLLNTLVPYLASDRKGYHTRFNTGEIETRSIYRVNATTATILHPMATTNEYDDKEKYDSGQEDFSSGSSTPQASHALLEDGRRLEEQAESAQSTQQIPAEHRSSYAKKLIFLGAYFLLNLTLTISNKALLGKVCAHDCPYGRTRELTLYERRISHGSLPHYTPPQLQSAAS